MRKQFYLDFKTRLKNIVTDPTPPAEPVQIIKHFDIWNNQLDPEWTEQFRFPAVFIGFRPIQWKVQGHHRQEAMMDFDVHIVTQTKARSSDKSPFQTAALAHYELIDAIHYWLTAWRGDYFSSVSRIMSAQPDFYLDLIRHVETYRCLVKDDSAVRTMTSIGGGDRLILNFGVFEFPDPKPIALFSANKLIPLLGETVQLTDLSEYDPTEWIWEISPESHTISSRSAQNPTVVFNDDVKYTIQLTASNASGSDVKIKTDYIDVQPPD